MNGLQVLFLILFALAVCKWILSPIFGRINDAIRRREKQQRQKQIAETAAKYEAEKARNKYFRQDEQREHIRSQIAGYQAIAARLTEERETASATRRNRIDAELLKLDDKIFKLSQKL